MVPGPSSTAKLAVIAASATGGTATLTLRCSAATSERCRTTVTGTTNEHLAGGRLVSLTAARVMTRKAMKQTKRVTVVPRSATVSGGRAAHVMVALSKTGRALLSRFYAVPVRLIVSGAGRPTRTITFRYALIEAPIDYYFRSAASGDTSVVNLSARRL